MNLWALMEVVEPMELDGFWSRIVESDLLAREERIPHDEA